MRNQEIEIKYNLTKKQYEEIKETHFKYCKYQYYQKIYFKSDNAILRYNPKNLYFTFKYRLDELHRIEIENTNLMKIINQVIELKQYKIYKELEILLDLFDKNQIYTIVKTKRKLKKEQDCDITLDLFTDGYSVLYEIEFELKNDKQIFDKELIKKYIGNLKQDNRNKITKLDN